MKNEEKPKSEKTDEGQINAKNEGDSPDELTSLKEELEKAKKLLVSERNRRMFERLALRSNIRADRVDAAWRLSGFEQVAETLDEETVKKGAKQNRCQLPRIRFYRLAHSDRPVCATKKHRNPYQRPSRDVKSPKGKQITH